MTQAILSGYIVQIINSLNQKISLANLQKQDIRGVCFKVEGILRLYDRSKGVHGQDLQVLRKNLVLIKAIEDALGQAFFPMEVLEYAQAEKCYAAEAELKQQIQQVEAEFLKFLKKKQVIKQLQKFQQEIKQIKFRSNKFVVKAIRKEIKRINKKIKRRLQPIIEQNHYTLKELEDGVHEWRRMVRWISIYIQSHKELFKLVLESEDQKNSLVKKYQNNKFCQLGGPRAPYAISAVEFYRLSDYIVQLGEMKTQGENNFYIRKKMEIKIKPVRIEKLAHKLLQDFFKHQGLKPIKLVKAN